jgi:hypothetical protein
MRAPRPLRRFASLATAYVIRDLLSVYAFDQAAANSVRLLEIAAAVRCESVFLDQRIAVDRDVCGNLAKRW